MRRWGWLALACLVGVMRVCSVSAGIYNPGERDEAATPPDFIDSPTGRNFREIVYVLRSIGDPRPQVDNAVRRQYRFEEKLVTGRGEVKSLADRLQASAVLLRCRKFKDAELLLRPAATLPEERDNLPLQSNFATALHLSGNLQDALFTLRPVVNQDWKTPWAELPEPRRQFYADLGWSDAEYELYREYDRYYLKLLQLRLREQLSKKAGKGIIEPPDALFDDGKTPPTPVRFVGDTGSFEAGSLALAERAKLPRNALAYVQKLVVWLPDDYRLYWLLGELYNVQDPAQESRKGAGIRSALQIFSELQTIINLSREDAVSPDVRAQIKERVNALSTAVDLLNQAADADIQKKLNQTDKAPAEAPFDWRTAGISFGFGFVVAIFVVWQVREIQRRRQARPRERLAPPDVHVR